MKSDQRQQHWEQLSLFGRDVAEVPAVSLFDGEEYGAEEPAAWMKKLVPDGEYFVMVGVHPLVLRATDMRCEDVQEGHRFYHYQIDGTVYAGIFVGKETAA